jgi:integrase
MKKSFKIKAIVDEYLLYRRSLGFDLKIEGQELQRFARYADKSDCRGAITTDIAIAWARQNKKSSPIYKARRLDMVRRLAKYRALFDPKTEIPPEGILGPSYRRLSPHIYSETEIAFLLKEAWMLGPKGGLRPRTYATLLGLLFSTGMRISEALNLDRRDVDLQSGVLTIRCTKFKKTRIVPLHQSTTNALKRYDDYRARYFHRDECPAFFATEKATRQKYHKTLMTFLKLRKKMGWNNNGLSGAPRIHDMRHTFAVRRLLSWYQQGIDVNCKVAALATYMGHVKVSDTYWYFSTVPELMAVAGRRYEQYAFSQKGIKK